MTIQNPSYYSILTADVRYDIRLKPNEKILFSEITCLTNKNGICTAGNKYFSKLYKVETETISRWISNLKKYGYLSVKINYKKGTKHIIGRDITLLAKKSIPIDQKINTPIDKIVKGNSTSLNTTSNNKKESKPKNDLIKVEMPESLNIAAWNEWIDYKKEIKKPYKTERGIKTAMNKLAAIPYENQKACIDNSISNEYQGFFPEKFTGQLNGNQNNQKRETVAERTHRQIRELRGQNMGKDVIDIPDNICKLER